MTDIPGLEQSRFDEYKEQTTVDIINEIPIRFLHYNQLIENKAATNRKKDQLDIEELQKINKR